MKNNLIIVLVVLLILSIGSTVYFSRKYSNTKSDLDNSVELLNISNKELVQFRNDLGEFVASKEVLELNNIENLKKIKSKDSTINQLQSIIKKSEKRFSSIKSITTIKTQTKYDTVYKESEVPSQCPNLTRISSINNKWINTTFGYRNDSTVYQLKVNNEYELVIGEENQKWYSFKKPKLKSDLTNLNPYTSILDTNSVVIKDETKYRPWSVGATFGYGIDKNFDTDWYLVFGIHRSLFRF